MVFVVFIMDEVLKKIDLARADDLLSLMEIILRSDLNLLIQAALKCFPPKADGKAQFEMRPVLNSGRVEN